MRPLSFGAQPLVQKCEPNVGVNTIPPAHPRGNVRSVFFPLPSLRRLQRVGEGAVRRVLPDGAGRRVEAAPRQHPRHLQPARPHLRGDGQGRGGAETDTRRLPLSRCRVLILPPQACTGSNVVLV